MTREQQQESARLLLRQIQIITLALGEAAGTISNLVSTEYVTDELIRLFIEDCRSTDRLLKCATACVDNVEQSARVEE